MGGAVRLTRDESRALTRQRLLAAASALFRRDGYAATSVERIAEAAGYSKGAVYSNFSGKEAIFLAVLEADGAESLRGLIGALARVSGKAAVIDRLAEWADARSRDGGWSLTILEHARLAGAEAPSLRAQIAIIRGNWHELGHYLLGRFPAAADNGDRLGALLFEIASAPALTFVGTPTAGDLMRMVLERFLPDDA